MSQQEGTPVPVISGLAGLRAIGRGGFSLVYRAHQPAFDREVAVKVLTVDLRDSRSRREFEQECRLAGRLGGHPNIVTVFGSGFTSEGRGYIVMELFPAGSLAERVQRGGPLPPADVARIGVRIAGALETAHRRDVLHRDLKPQNILLSPYDEPALADFGVAAFASSVEQGTTPLALTPLHAPPEVLEGNLPTVAADVYSLCSTLYELLAGRPAYAATAGGENDVLGVLLRMRSAPLAPIARGDLPEPLHEVVRAGMALAPDARFPTAASLGEALQAAQRAGGWPLTELPLPVLEAGLEAPAFQPQGEVEAVTIGVPHVPAPRQSPPPAPVLGPAGTPQPPPAPPAGGVGGSLPPAVGGAETVGVPAPVRPRLEPAAPAAEGPASRRHTLVTVTAVIVGLLVTVAVVTLVLDRGSSPKQHGTTADRTTSVGSATSSSTAPTTAAGPALKPPTGVKVASAGQPGAYTVTWTDTNAGQAPYVVASIPQPDGQRVLAHQANGVGLFTTTSALVAGLDPSVPYCFEVGAVRPENGVIGQPSWSEPVCP